MREVAYIEYNLNIQGLYGWGTGWIREPERVVGKLKKNLDELMKIIRETFPEVNITAQLKTRKVVMDFDRCTHENFDM